MSTSDWRFVFSRALSDQMKLIRAVLAILFVLLIAGLFAPSTSRFGASLSNHLFPVVKDFSASRWVRDVTTGYWSAEVHGTISRGTNCAYVKGQRVSGVAINPDDTTVEFYVSYVQDTVPGNSRPHGAQSFGRWSFDHAGIQPEARVLVAVLHQCPDDTSARRSTIGPFVVGR